MAKRAHGGRQGTRSILKKKKADRSRVFINRVMHPYAEGDRVAIVLDGAQQKGMPHRRITLNGRPARIAAAGRPTQRSSGGCVTR